LEEEFYISFLSILLFKTSTPVMHPPPSISNFWYVSACCVCKLPKKAMDTINLKISYLYIYQLS